MGFTLEGRYRIVREVGRGGMGIVYEAENTDLGKRVAVKLMLDKYADDTEAVARFRREAFAASTIGNSHIIDVSHIGKAPDGRPFVVMELLIGLPLAQVIEMTGPMPPWRAIAIMRQVLRAVGAAHAKGIVHRDLKPDNIFLVEQDDQKDFVKLLDFGISKMMDGESAVAHTKLTSTGMVMGTPLYMAPEQAMGTAVDHRADIYACGVILYEMLSGRPPFEGATYPVLIAKLLTAEPTPILERVPGLPMRLVSAVHRALEKEPEKRFESSEAFYMSLPVPSTPSQMELAGTLGVGPASLQMDRIALPTAPQHAAGGARKNGLWIALAAAAGVAVAGLGVVIATRPGEIRAASASGPGSAAGASGPTVQPIDPPPPKPPADPAVGSAAGIAAHQPVPQAPAGSVGALRVQATPADSSVAVDGVPEGLAGQKIPLGIGLHNVHVEHVGFAPSDQQVMVNADETSAITVKLVTPSHGPVVHGSGSAHPPGVGDGSGALRPGDPYAGSAGPTVLPHDIPTPHDTPPHSATPKPNPYGP